MVLISRNQMLHLGQTESSFPKNEANLQRAFSSVTIKARGCGNLTGLVYRVIRYISSIIHASPIQRDWINGKKWVCCRSINYIRTLECKLYLFGNIIT